MELLCPPLLFSVILDQKLLKKKAQTQWSGVALHVLLLCCLCDRVNQAGFPAKECLEILKLQ